MAEGILRRLDGKVCLITGTGGTLGRAVSLVFAYHGARIVGCDLNVANAEATSAAVVAEGGEMISIAPADLTKGEICARLVSAAVERFGAIDVLVNAAGVARFAPFDHLSRDDWDGTIAGELTCLYEMTKATWKELKKSSGVVVNVASVAATMGFKELPSVAHCAAKGGVVAMTRQLAIEGRHHGIRVNALSPGIIATPITLKKAAETEYGAAMLGKTMRGRFGEPEEIAHVALFLASDESSFVNGADIIVDGGFSAW